MTFEQAEIASGAKPVECYLFQTADTVWRYTSAASNVVIGEDTYVAVAIGRKNLELNDESAKQSLGIECGRDLPLLNVFIDMPITVTIYRVYGDVSAVIWKGRVITKSFAGERGTINCESVFTSMKRPGLRRKYQILCPHVLFGSGCNVSRDTYAVSCVVVSATGTSVVVDTVGGHPNQWFKAGFLRSGNQYRTINSQSGTTLTMDRPMDVEPDDALTIFPGCQHTMAECADKFDNLINYGGWPWIPAINPFSDLGGRL